LIGAGRSELFKVLSGHLLRDRREGGDIIVRGNRVAYGSPSDALVDGVVYITEDRKVDGFFPGMRASGNIYVGLLAKENRSRHFVHAAERKALGKDWGKALQVRSGSDDPKVVELSGGNQQKIVIARALAQKPDIVIFDEPTKGVDVGAIAEIHKLINGLADEGRTVIVISSYMPELLALSDRVLVMRAGEVVADFGGGEATEEKVMAAAVH
jgi:simple sugar transport system ATP-binding protein